MTAAPCGSGRNPDPRATVAIATASGFGRTVLYANWNGLVRPELAFDLLAAAVTVTATGAGLHSAATASAKPQQ